MTKTIATILLLFNSVGNVVPAQDSYALITARKVADKVIGETKFAFEMVLQKQQLGMQVIDFAHFGMLNNKTAYAFHRPQVTRDTVVNFGVTSGGNIKVWVNRQLVFHNDGGSASNPKEFAYGRFKFDTLFSVKLKKGDNEMLLSYEGGAGGPVIFLRPIAKETLDLNTAVKFDEATGWRMAPFPASDKSFNPTDDLKTHYVVNGTIIAWKAVPVNFLPELKIDTNATYRRESYADWNYANGTTLWSMMLLDSNKYVEFVKKYSRFILDNYRYFKWQYDSLFAYRGSYHRMFRLSMLDDSGTPALPLVELYLNDKDPALRALIDPIAKYVYHDQLRLDDGTFCRPEPVNYTVWADDLFMSVPFLLRMGRITGEQKYYDDAAKQLINFKKYLLDSETGLYKHGWFSNTNELSVAYWGRANGWVAWATTEALTWLPVTHPQYKTILKMFKEHMRDLVTYQDASGMWHQLLDRKDSYEETSCTALFTLAMARGVRKGWINKAFKKSAIIGWNAVKKNIDEDGTVHGICRGTEIGFDEAFYINRPTVDHDPRGLGAIITAAVEISKLK